MQDPPKYFRTIPDVLYGPTKALSVVLWQLPFHGPILEETVYSTAYLFSPQNHMKHGIVSTRWMNTIYQQNDGFYCLATVEFAYKELSATLYPNHALSQSLWQDSFTSLSPHCTLGSFQFWKFGEATITKNYLPACQKLM